MRVFRLIFTCPKHQKLLVSGECELWGMFFSVFLHKTQAVWWHRMHDKEGIIREQQRLHEGQRAYTQARRNLELKYDGRRDNVWVFTTQKLHKKVAQSWHDHFTTYFIVHLIQLFSHLSLKCLLYHYSDFLREYCRSCWTAQLNQSAKTIKSAQSSEHFFPHTSHAIRKKNNLSSVFLCYSCYSYQAFFLIFFRFLLVFFFEKTLHLTKSAVYISLFINTHNWDLIFLSIFPPENFFSAFIHLW